jgi:hypothetical protein
MRIENRRAPNELKPRISVILASSCHFPFSFSAPALLELGLYCTILI